MIVAVYIGVGTAATIVAIPVIDTGIAVVGIFMTIAVIDTGIAVAILSTTLVAIAVTNAGVAVDIAMVIIVAATIGVADAGIAVVIVHIGIVAISIITVGIAIDIVAIDIIAVGIVSVEIDIDVVCIDIVAVPVGGAVAHLWQLCQIICAGYFDMRDCEGTIGIDISFNLDAIPNLERTILDNCRIDRQRLTIDDPLGTFHTVNGAGVSDQRCIHFHSSLFGGGFGNSCATGT